MSTKPKRIGFVDLKEDREVVESKIPYSDESLESNLKRTSAMLKGEVETTLLGLCDIWFNDIKPQLMRDNVKLRLHEDNAECGQSRLEDILMKRSIDLEGLKHRHRRTSNANYANFLTTQQGVFTAHAKGENLLKQDSNKIVVPLQELLEVPIQRSALIKRIADNYHSAQDESLRTHKSKKHKLYSEDLIDIMASALKDKEAQHYNSPASNVVGSSRKTKKHNRRRRKQKRSPSDTSSTAHDDYESMKILVKPWLS